MSKTLRANLIAAAFLAVHPPVEAQVAGFFAPAETTGSLVVRLYPMENVTTSTPRLVTLGVPFPRGSVSAAGLDYVRVLKGGVEIPAYVEALTPWRHINNPSLNGTSVRVARLQIQNGFTARYPNYEEITVEWGVSPRTQNVTTLQDPRLGWHDVTSGSFGAADGVREPDVYAVLPKGHLTKGALRPMRMSPMDDSVPEQREDPAVMDATETWPGFIEMDHASKNNVYSVINQDDPGVTLANQCPYKTDSEPWLYDRASTMFGVYMRGGHLKALREAVRHAEFYRTKLYPPGTTPSSAVGCFRLKNPDPAGYIGGNGAMYAYNEPLAYQYWLTGDPLAVQAIPWIVNCHELNDEPTRWSTTEPGWTERHTAFRLLANVVAYEVFGDADSMSRVVSQSGDFIWHQNGADGQLPANRVDGGLWHWMRQHEGFDDPTMMASPWMSALTVDAMVRAFAVTEDNAIGNFVRRMGTFMKAGTKLVPPSLYDYQGDLREVDYITYITGATYPNDGTTPEHALELTASLAWANYFATGLGQPDTSLAQAAQQLYLTYDVGVNYWIRPTAPASGLTAYRVAPWRKWGWEHRVAGSLSWLFTRFYDVPPSHAFYGFIEILARNGITSGCSVNPPLYCPQNSVTRGQMAVFLLRSQEGGSYTPPACVSPVFGDVPCSHAFAAWINEISARGVTSGCGGGNYCPQNPVSRAQMAVLLLRTREGSSYTPPACTNPTFADVPCGGFFAPWIYDLAAQGITSGCGGGNYCPTSAVSRGQMAAFLVRTFGLV